MHLADWMKSQDLDDHEVARKVRTDRVTISRIRRRLNRPSWQLAAKFKRISGGKITADDFLPNGRKRALEAAE